MLASTDAVQGLASTQLRSECWNGKV